MTVELKDETCLEKMLRNKINIRLDYGNKKKLVKFADFCRNCSVFIIKTNWPDTQLHNALKHD